MDDPVKETGKTIAGSQGDNIKRFIPALIVCVIVGMAARPNVQAASIKILDIVTPDVIATDVFAADVSATDAAVKTKKPVAVKKPKEVAARSDKAGKVNTSGIDLSDCADGAYIGTGTGYAGYIKTEVKIKSHKITAIKIVENEADDAPYMAKAKKVISYILKAQSLDVDTVSGCTYSSNGIIGAVKDALQQAAGQAAKKSKKALKGVVDNANNQRYKDGTYVGTGVGFVGDITVEVTIASGKISSIKVTKHKEDQPYMNNAMKLIKNILKAQSTDVDTISGATYSSKGIIAAVKDALKKALVVEDPNAGDDDSGDQRPGNTDGQTPGDTDEQTPDDEDVEPTYGLYVDGTYLGAARGYKSIFYATVIIENESISAITIKQDDDEDYYNKCVGIIQKIINRQTTEGIDTVSGCTLSSNGILSSVKSALDKAKKPTDPELP